MDRRRIFVRKRPGHVDAFDLSGETWTDLFDLDGHGRRLLPAARVVCFPWR
jgi:hypothetical protein